MQDVLQKIEKREQKEFGDIYDECGDDEELEKQRITAAYARHAQCGQPGAIVAKMPDGTLRTIRQEDVEKYVAEVYAAAAY